MNILLNITIIIATGSLIAGIIWLIIIFHEENKKIKKLTRKYENEQRNLKR